MQSDAPGPSEKDDARVGRSLQAAVDALATLRSLEEAIPRMLPIACQLLCCDGAAILEGESPTTLTLLGAYSAAGSLPADCSSRLTAPAAMRFGRLAEGVLEIAGADAAPALAGPSVTRIGDDALLFVPLAVDKRFSGALTAVRGGSEPFTDRDLSLARHLGNLLGLILQAARVAAREREIALLNERARLAADMHDSIAQSFTSIAMQSEALLSRLPADRDEREPLRMIARTARSGMVEAKGSIIGLKPRVTTPGWLEHVLADLARRCSIPGALQCRFDDEGGPCRLPADAQNAILRVTQEAVSNALKHSAASQVRISLLTREQTTALTIIDNGRGIPRAAVPPAEGTPCDDAGPRFGVRSMAERARSLGAEFSVGPAECGGTIVRMIIKHPA